MGAERARVLIVGCGDVGLRAGLRLAERGYEVTGLRRRPERLVGPIRGVGADVCDRASLAVLGELGQFDYVLVTTAAGGAGEAGYRAVYVQGLANVLNSLVGAAPRRILLASSTSVYHQRDGSRVDEHSPTEPSGYAGRVMLEAEALLAATGLPATVVRFAGIYGPGRLHLVKMLRDGLMPAAAGQLSNRIHSDDCAGVLVHLLDGDRGGEALAPCYLAVDSAPTPLRDVCYWLAQRLGIDAASLEERGRPLRGGNKYCSNRLLLAAGYRFRYADFRAGFGALLADASSATC